MVNRKPKSGKSLDFATIVVVFFEIKHAGKFLPGELKIICHSINQRTHKERVEQTKTKLSWPDIPPAWFTDFYHQTNYLQKYFSVIYSIFFKIV